VLGVGTTPHLNSRPRMHASGAFLVPSPGQPNSGHDFCFALQTGPNPQPYETTTPTAMHHTRLLLTCAMLGLALLAHPAEADYALGTARAASGCVVCHTNRDMLKSALDVQEKRVSALIEGPG
jgi:hypothetical protein